MPGLFAPWFTPTGAAPATTQKTPAQILQEQTDYGNAWMQSPFGQRTMEAEDSATAYARKQADAAMQNAKRQLDNQVATLKQQGRYQEAQIALEKGNQKIARDRLAWEQQIKQQELALQKEQFDKTYGLDRAKALTAYESTPDQYWSQRDFRGALAATEGGQGPAPIAQGVAQYGAPHMKTSSDFDAIAGPSGSLAAPVASPAMPGPGGGSSGTPNTTSTPTDPRLSAMSAVAKAIPPSGDTGLDDNDMAALKAIQHIYLAGQPGSLERLGAQRRKIAQAGLARSGFDPALMEEEYQRGLPGQASARAA